VEQFLNVDSTRYVEKYGNDCLMVVEKHVNETNGT